MSNLSLSLSLRVAAIFEILLLALIGISLPFLLLHQRAKKSILESEACESCASCRDEDKIAFKMKSMLQSLFFMSMKSVSAGVMLGVAMLHLLPDADGDLTEVYPDYNLANAFTCFGIVLVLAIDQFTISWVKSRKNSSNSNVLSKIDIIRDVNSISTHDHSHSHGHDECGRSCHLENDKPKREFDVTDFEHNERCSFVGCEHEDPNPVQRVDTYLAPVPQSVSTDKSEGGNQHAKAAWASMGSSAVSEDLSGGVRASCNTQNMSS